MSPRCQPPKTPTPNLSHWLFLPKGTDVVVALCLGVVEAEERESADGQQTQLLLLQNPNESPCQLPQGTSCQTSESHQSFGWKHLWGHIHLCRSLLLHGFWAVISFFNLTSTIFHLSKIHQMFFGQLLGSIILKTRFLPFLETFVGGRGYKDFHNTCFVLSIISLGQIIKNRTLRQSI